jgi:hypothetical protein
MTMNALQREHFKRAMGAAHQLFAAAQYDEAQHQLERAHVLGQRDVWPHVLTHWHMLRIAIRRGPRLAVAGQGARIVLGAIGSAIGRVPTGNTGGTNVSIF